MRLRAIGIVALSLVTLGTPVAFGAECYGKVVHARGGYSILEATARSRARTAWIKKVRAKKKLGRDYAAWLRARDRTYACQKHAKRTACTASAIPCAVDAASPH